MIRRKLKCIKNIFIVIKVSFEHLNNKILIDER